MRQMATTPMVVMISGHGNIETAVRATKLGAFDFIEKPLSIEKITRSVKNALEVQRLAQENRRLREELGGRTSCIGDSVPMKALRQQIALTAPTNGRVLIYGESGTGKELVARALHAASLRGERAFVEVNCAAIPEELIESELFGHIKGSFTGASENKVGKFEKADDGTLFLDEVGDMSLRTQAKVLRVLEEQRLEPVGSNQPVERQRARDRRDQQETGGRDRPRAFPRRPLLPAQRHSLHRAAAARAHRGHSDAGAPLPGWNLRRLRPQAQGAQRRGPRRADALPLAGKRARAAQSDRAAGDHLSRRTSIEPLHLPPELFRASARMAPQPYATLHEARSAYEREFILRKLEENQWHMTRTAEALGLERSHLYRRMRTLGIKTEE